MNSDRTVENSFGSKSSVRGDATTTVGQLSSKERVKPKKSEDERNVGNFSIVQERRTGDAIEPTNVGNSENKKQSVPLAPPLPVFATRPKPNVIAPKVPKDLSFEAQWPPESQKAFLEEIRLRYGIVATELKRNVEND